MLAAIVGSLLCVDQIFVIPLDGEVLVLVTLFSNILVVTLISPGCWNKDGHFSKVEIIPVRQ